MKTSIEGPLDGIRVVDASTILAGPLCCQILGDYGADVIKIEHPSLGDGLRGHGQAKGDVALWWKEVSRNKRTLGLSLSTSSGAEIFRHLMESTDVLVENFRPGTLERWGLGPEVLHDINPDLVIVRVTGFGQTGPYSQRPGFGTLAEAMSGFAHLTGEADGPPTLPAFGLADSICGIAASSATVMALLARERGKSRGQVIDMNLLSPILAAVGPHVTAFDQLGTIETRHGNRSINNSPRNTYATKDDRWVAVSASSQKVAERVLSLVGHPEVALEPWFSSGRGRAAHSDLIDGLVGTWISERTLGEVSSAFETAGAAVAPIYDARDILEDEHVRATEMIISVQDEELGPIRMHNVMWGMSKTPGSIRHTGRTLGADTESILSELGMAPSYVAELREQDVVR